MLRQYIVAATKRVHACSTTSRSAPAALMMMMMMLLALFTSAVAAQNSQSGQSQDQTKNTFDTNAIIGVTVGAFICAVCLPMTVWIAIHLNKDETLRQRFGPIVEEIDKRDGDADDVEQFLKDREKERNTKGTK